MGGLWTVIKLSALVNISLFKKWQFVWTGGFGLGLEIELDNGLDIISAHFVARDRKEG